ncbi:TniQ protein [Phorcysia thermohydrogeniphila]|uniref:TniQ protein n=2 Tax=Phorcysia thermohydrogeniphila TaxID=936138 RepID=A0A4R1GB19_9BACT|nr:TniQ protein [Phorcysia thermohydrogeniphila]
MAVKNFTIPSSFLNLYFGNYQSVFNGDFDWNREDFVKALSQRVGFKKERVWNLTLKSYEGYLFEAQKKFNSNKPFINPVGFRGGRNRRHGLRFCPYCLREEEYFRKEWRLTFSTACVKHKVFLLDRCPECGEPLTIQKWKPDKFHFHCWKCGFEFMNAKAEEVPKESKGIEAIRLLYEILKKGYFEFEDRVYYSIAYFKVLEHFTKVVYNWQKRNWGSIRIEEENIGVRLDKKKKRLYYDAPIKVQYILFTVITDILSSKENLEKFIVDNKLKKTELTRDFRDYPFWYKKFVDKYSDKGYAPTLREIEEAVKYLRKRGLKINWINLRKITGRFLDSRKRRDVNFFFDEKQIQG